MQIQKLKLGQQNNDEGSIYLAGANKKATLKCKLIIIKRIAKLYESVYCHSTPKFGPVRKGGNWVRRYCPGYCYSVCIQFFGNI